MIEQQPLGLNDWVAQILKGDARAVSRAISAVENREAQGTELVKRLFPHTGRATLIGVTGATGSGKSTLVDALVAALRKKGRTVGILAVDPTSPFTGGALLGDRIRMQAHATDPGTYIRSMATRGSLGGLAGATLDAAMVLDAAGKEFILVETVGVGQDEVDIARIADVTLLLLVPGMGDEVQAFKAGVMEIADIFVVNKSDRDGAARLEQEIHSVLHLAPSQTEWQPPIVKTVATRAEGIRAAPALPVLSEAEGSEAEGTVRERTATPILRTVATRAEGVEELLDTIAQYLDFARNQGTLKERRMSYWQGRILEILRERVLEQLLPQALTNGALNQYAAAVAARELDPYSVADQIMQQAGLSGLSEPRPQGSGG